MIFGIGKISQSVFRPLRADAATQCATIHASSFAHPWTAPDFVRLIASDSNVNVAALDPTTNKLRGYVISRVVLDEAEILTIAVSRQLRGKGIASSLLAQHMSQLAGRGVESVFLEVDPQNAAAVALYRRHDFKIIGERPGYYRRPGASPVKAQVMRKLLT